MSDEQPTVEAPAAETPAAAKNEVQWFVGREGVLRAATSPAELALFSSRPGWEKVTEAEAQKLVASGDQSELNEARKAEDQVRREQEREAEAEKRRRDRTQVVIVPEGALQNPKPDQQTGSQS